ncbi:hypothetical protein ACFL0R_01565 [Pseudomonadota bacterium]
MRKLLLLVFGVVLVSALLGLTMVGTDENDVFIHGKELLAAGAQIYKDSLGQKEKFHETNINELIDRLFGVSLRKDIDAVKADARTHKIKYFNNSHPSKKGLGVLQLSAALDNASSVISLNVSYFQNTTYKINARTRDGQFIEHVIALLKENDIGEIPANDRRMNRYFLSPKTILEIFYQGPDNQGSISIWDNDGFVVAESAYNRFPSKAQAPKKAFPHPISVTTNAPYYGTGLRKEGLELLMKGEVTMYGLFHKLNMVFKESGHLPIVADEDEAYALRSAIIGNYTSVSLKDMLEDLERKHPIRVFWSDDKITVRQDLGFYVSVSLQDKQGLTRLTADLYTQPSAPLSIYEPPEDRPAAINRNKDLNILPDDVGSKPESLGDRAWLMITSMHKMLKSADSDLDFYGRVIDQDGNPVAEANVLARINYYAGFSPLKLINMEDTGKQKWINLKTDQNGYFLVKGEKGSSLFLLIYRDGYLGTERDYVYSYNRTERNWHMPDAKQPEEFMLWKKSGGAPLEKTKLRVEFERQKGEDNRGFFPPQGLHLEDERKLKGLSSDIRIKAYNGANPGEPRRRKYDWAVSIAIPGGGLIESNDKYRYQAPADGYQGSITFKAYQEDPQWMDDVGRRQFEDRYYYFRDRHGVYGSFKLDIVAHRDGRVWVSFNDLIYNPDGSHNLEPDREDSSKQMLWTIEQMKKEGEVHFGAF